MSTSNCRYFYTDPSTGAVLERRLARLGGFFSVSDHVVTSPDLLTPAISAGSLDSPARSPAVGLEGLYEQLGESSAFPRLAAAGIDLSRIRRNQEDRSFTQAGQMIVDNGPLAELLRSVPARVQQEFLSKSASGTTGRLRSTTFEDVILGGGSASRQQDSRPWNRSRGTDEEEALLSLISNTLAARRGDTMQNDSSRVPQSTGGTDRLNSSTYEDVILSGSAPASRRVDFHRVQPSHGTDDEEALLSLINNTLSARRGDALTGTLSRVTRRRVVIVEEGSPEPLLSSTMGQFPTVASPGMSNRRRHSMPIRPMYPSLDSAAQSFHSFELPEDVSRLPARYTTIVEPPPELPTHSHQQASCSTDSPRRIYPLTSDGERRFLPRSLTSDPMDDSSALRPFHDAGPDRYLQQEQILYPQAADDILPPAQPTPSRPLHSRNFTLHDLSRASPQPPSHYPSEPPTTADPVPVLGPTDLAPGHVSALRDLFETKLREQRRFTPSPTNRPDVVYDSPGDVPPEGGRKRERRREKEWREKRARERERAPTSPPAFSCPDGRFEAQGLELRGEVEGDEDRPSLLLSQSTGAGVQGPAASALRRLESREGNGMRRSATPRFGSRSAVGEQRREEKVRSWASMSERMDSVPSLAGLARGVPAEADVPSAKDERTEERDMLPKRRSRECTATQSLAPCPSTQERPSTSAVVVHDSTHGDSPQVVLSPPAPEKLNDLYASLYATGMFDSGVSGTLSVGPDVAGPSQGRAWTEKLDVPKIKEFVPRPFLLSTVPKKVDRSDFFDMSSSSDGARSAPTGTPRTIISLGALAATAAETKAGDMKAAGSVTPSDFGEWRQFSGIVYDGATASRDEDGGMSVVDDRSPDVDGEGARRFGEGMLARKDGVEVLEFFPAQDQQSLSPVDDARTPVSVVDDRSPDVDGEGARRFGEGMLARKDGVEVLEFFPAQDQQSLSPVDDARTPCCGIAPQHLVDISSTAEAEEASPPVHTVYGLGRRSSSCEDEQTDHEDVTDHFVGEAMFGGEALDKTQYMQKFPPMSLEELVIIPRANAEVQINGADVTDIPQELPSNIGKIEPGAIAATQSKAPENELVVRTTASNTPPRTADVDRCQDASMCESMDQSFARAPTTLPLLIPQLLDTSADQSLISQSPPPLVLAHAEPRATLPPSADCAAVLPAGSDFAGAPLPTFPESDFLSFADKLPVHAGLPTKDGLPPLDSWEDICAEMNYLCSRLGIPCTVSLV